MSVSPGKCGRMSVLAVERAEPFPRRAVSPARVRAFAEHCP
jgi:hypothetical protein